MKIDRSTQLILFILAFAMLFVFTTSDQSQIKESANWNLLAVGAFGSFILVATTNKEFLPWFRIASSLEFLQDITIGLITGFLLAFAASYVVSGVHAVVNLSQTVTFASLAASTSSEIFFIGLIQPLTETMILVASILMISRFLARQKIPFSKVWAILIVAIAFTGLHFLILGKGNYEYSVDGFVRFIFDTSNYGTAGYTGALPILILAIGWGILAITYRSYVVAWFAHEANNLMALFFAGLTGDSAIVFNIIVLIMVLTAGFMIFKYRFKPFEEFSLRRVLDNG